MWMTEASAFINDLLWRNGGVIEYRFEERHQLVQPALRKEHVCEIHAGNIERVARGFMGRRRVLNICTGRAAIEIQRVARKGCDEARRVASFCES